MPIRNLIYALLKVVTSAVAPGRVQAMEYLDGFFAIHVASALVQLGVAKALSEGPATLEELVTATNCDRDRLHRLLAVAQVQNMVSYQNGHWRARPVVRSLASKEEVFGSYIQWMTTQSQSTLWPYLTEIVRDGHSGPQLAYGTSMWNWLDDHQADALLFDEVLASIVRLDTPDILRTVQFPTSGVVCDVGGGTGDLLINVLKAHPNLQGVLVDLPHATERANQRMQAAGLVDRARCVAADIFVEIPVDADLYMIKSVLHNWNDEHCLRLLRNIHSRMQPDNRLVFTEIAYERKLSEPISAFADLQVMVTCEDGRERSASELDTLALNAGFSRTQAHGLRSGLIVLEATP